MKMSKIYAAIAVFLLLSGMGAIASSIGVLFMTNLAISGGDLVLMCLVLFGGGCVNLYGFTLAADKEFTLMNTTEHPQWCAQQVANAEWQAGEDARTTALAQGLRQGFVSHVYETNAVVTWSHNGSGSAVDYSRLPAGVQVGDTVYLDESASLACSVKEEAYWANRCSACGNQRLNYAELCDCCEHQVAEASKGELLTVTNPDFSLVFALVRTEHGAYFGVAKPLVPSLVKGATFLADRGELFTGLQRLIDTDCEFAAAHQRDKDQDETDLEALRKRRQFLRDVSRIGQLLLVLGLALGLSSCAGDIVCRDDSGTLFPVYNGRNMDVEVGDTVAVGLNNSKTLYIAGGPDEQVAQMTVVRK